MKNLIYILVAVISFNSACFGQKINTIGEPKIIIDGKNYKSEPFVMTSGRFINFTITVSSDFVGMNGPDCFTVNVRVYMTSSLGTTLVANQNVDIGSGCGQNRKINKSSSKCPEVQFKGDLILDNKDSFDYCLIEFFRDDTIYQVFKRIKTDFLIRNVKN